jgi:Domain of unknown function (DUF4936)
VSSRRGVTQLAYYVYYRIAPGVDAGDRVRAAQAEVVAAMPSSARLLIKRGEPDLWMEVYEGVTDADRFERLLAAAVERHGLAQLTRPGSARKIECFVVPECA